MPPEILTLTLSLQESIRYARSSRLATRLLCTLHGRISLPTWNLDCHRCSGWRSHFVPPTRRRYFLFRDDDSGDCRCRGGRGVFWQRCRLGGSSARVGHSGGSRSGHAFRRGQRLPADRPRHATRATRVPSTRWLPSKAGRSGRHAGAAAAANTGGCPVHHKARWRCVVSGFSQAAGRLRRNERG